MAKKKVRTIKADDSDGFSPSVSRKKTWLDDPAKLSDEIRDRKAANMSSIWEGRTYAGLYYAVPAEITDVAATQILDEKGMRKLGYNLVNELGSTAIRQVCVELTAHVNPIGGDAEDARACQAFGLILDGSLEEARFIDVGRQAAVDAICFNTGGHIFVEVDPLLNRLIYERLLPDEVFYSSDRTRVVFTRYMDRRRARARFAGKDPKLREIINKADTAKPDHIVGAEYFGKWDAEDNIAVEYGYALALGDEPARQVVKIGGTVVIDRKFIDGNVLPMLPIAPLVWNLGHHGEFDGRSMARSAAGPHSWIQELIWKMYDSLSAAVPWVSGGDPKWQPSDVPFKRVPPDPDTGAPGQITIPPGVSADVRQAVEDLIAAGGRATHVSEQATAGAPPAEITSGVGLANWKAIVNEALGPQHQAWDRLWTTAAKISVEMGKNAWNTPGARKKAMSSRLLEGLDFSKLDLAKNSYELSFDVTSNLGEHMPMKVELLELGLKRGVIDTPRYFQLLDMPDWRAATKRMNGPRDLLEYQIAMALHRGLVIPPCEFQDPAVVAKEAGDAWCAAMASLPLPTRNGLQALRTLAQIARDMAAAQAPPPAPPAPGGGAPAGAAPMPNGAPPAPALPPQ